MTTRKKSGKSKSKSMRNGRTKRGGFLNELFNKSFSWFSSENKPTSENKPFDWTFGLKDKLNPPPVPQGPTIIPGRPQPQQDMPDAAQDSTTASQASQAAASQTASQPASQSPPQVIPTPVKGGSRLRVRTKKRSCRCKRK